MITGLDKAVRQGLQLGNIGGVMTQRQAELKTLFRIQKGLPQSLKAPFEVRVFLWQFVMAWKAAGYKADEVFLEKQRKALQKFNAIDMGALEAAAGESRPAQALVGPSNRQEAAATTGGPDVQSIIPRHWPRYQHWRHKNRHRQQKSAPGARKAQKPAPKQSAPPPSTTKHTQDQQLGTAITPEPLKSAQKMQPQRLVYSKGAEADSSFAMDVDEGEDEKEDEESEEEEEKYEDKDEENEDEVEVEENEKDEEDMIEEDELQVAKKQRAKPTRSDRKMVPPCVWCTRLGRTCWQQTKGISACHECGIQKLKCEQPGVRENRSVPQHPARKVNQAKGVKSKMVISDSDDGNDGVLQSNHGRVKEAKVPTMCYSRRIHNVY
ncbi:hypothetical protein JOM56_012978 [Amanita muscaria]